MVHPFLCVVEGSKEVAPIPVNSQHTMKEKNNPKAVHCLLNVSNRETKIRACPLTGNGPADMTVIAPQQSQY